MTGQKKNPGPKRRWWQYSLRTLLILVALAAGLLAAWRVYVEPYHQQREVMVLIEKLGGRAETQPSPAWVRWFLGENARDIVLVDLADCDEPDRYTDRISDLPSLKTLVVGGASFSDEQLSRLRDLATLRELVLDTTNVTASGIEMLRQQRPQLRLRSSQRRAIAAVHEWAVNMRTNSARPTFPASVPDEHFLDAHFVDFGDVGHVDDARVSHLKWLVQLEGLFLVGTRVSDAGLAHLNGLTHLNQLNLSATRIGDAGMRHVGSLTGLQVLSLHTTQVSSNGLRHLGGLARLRRLYLCYTQVDDAGLAHLRSLTKLEVLWLDGTQVTDAGMIHLRALRNLKQLSLVDTRVTDAALKDLQQTLPNCEMRQRLTYQ